MASFDPALDEAARAAWRKASKEEQEAALIQASAEIDRHFRFRGERATPRQSMSWPRTGVYGDDGNPIQFPGCATAACGSRHRLR